MCGICGFNCSTVTNDDRGWHNKARWIFGTLNLIDSQLPLSWHLSETSRSFIGLHAGNPGDCGNAFHATVPLWAKLKATLKENEAGQPRLLGALNAANCSASVICAQLADKKLAFQAGTDKEENYCTSWDAIQPAQETATARN